MAAISEVLRHDLTQPEFSEGYAESFQDAYIATQIKVLREQNEWTQAELAEKLNTQQTVISRIENVNYSSWNISTLRKLARAYRLRLKVSFESYGSLIRDVTEFSRESLRRTPREKDPGLASFMEDRQQEEAAIYREHTGPDGSARPVVHRTQEPPLNMEERAEQVWHEIFARSKSPRAIPEGPSQDPDESDPFKDVFDYSVQGRRQLGSQRFGPVSDSDIRGNKRSQLGTAACAEAGQ